METTALITARGGSKGIPGKNLASLAGKPLLAWVLLAAGHSRNVRRVLLSTDSEEIAGVGRQWGAEVPFLRPPELAQDDTPHVDVVLHAIRWLEENEGRKPEYIMLLQPTSPLTEAGDIDGAVDLAAGRRADAVVSVTEPSDHPYLCKRIESDGTLSDFMAVDIAYRRRQALPPAVALNGAIYLHRCEPLLENRDMAPNGALAYVMPAERSLDIDTPWDLHLADLILRARGDAQ